MKQAVEKVIGTEVTPRLKALDARMEKVEAGQLDHSVRLARLEGIEHGKHVVLATQSGHTITGSRAGELNGDGMEQT
jgi:hypothetical protein